MAEKERKKKKSRKFLRLVPIGDGLVVYEELFVHEQQYMYCVKILTSLCWMGQFSDDGVKLMISCFAYAS